jgi:hypothetical protein
VDVADWLARARRGAGVGGRHDSRTAYFWGERSWGGSLIGPCHRPKPPKEAKPDKGEKPPTEKPPNPSPPGNGGGGGGGGDGGGAAAP